MAGEKKSKVIPIRNPRKTRRHLTIFLGTFGVLLLILALFAVEGGKNWDAVRRFAAYGNEELRFELDTGADVLASMDGNLVTVGKEGITAYTDRGTVRFMATISLENPVLRTAQAHVLTFDAGGTDYLLLNRDGEILLQLNTEGSIFDGDLAPDGSVCYTCAGDRIRSVLQVYDREQLPCYTVRSASRYLTACTVSEGADYVCAVGLGQVDGLFASTAYIYRTDREEPIAEVSLGNQVIYDVEFWGDRICAVGEESAVVFTRDGKRIGEVTCTGVRSLDLDGDRFAALIVPSEVGWDLITVNQSARIAGRRPLGESAAVIDTAGKYVACLTSEGLTLSGQNLDPWYQTEEIGGAGKVCVCDVGSIYLLTSMNATRCLP